MKSNSWLLVCKTDSYKRLTERQTDRQTDRQTVVCWYVQNRLRVITEDRQADKKTDGKVSRLTLENTEADWQTDKHINTQKAA